jgi:hypothetical protein
LKNSFFVFFAAHGPESIQISPFSVGYFSDVGSKWPFLRLRISCAAFRSDGKIVCRTL